jgi:hypothetical protein
MLDKTTEGVTCMQQTSSAFIQFLAQMHADQQAGEDAKTKQRTEANRIDAAKIILADKDAYPQEVVRKAEQLLLNLFD